MKISSKKEEWLMKYAQRYHIIQQSIEGLIPLKPLLKSSTSHLDTLNALRKKSKN